MATVSLLAVNGSPKGRKSNTDRLLLPFLEGAAQAGADCEVIYAAEMQVQDCLGCFSCWGATPGVCVLHDDMPVLLKKILAAEVIVWATPLYAYGMTARLARIIERTLPLAKADIVSTDHGYAHPSRHEKRLARKVLISNCGFPDRRNFDALVATFEKYTAPTGLSASILCPMGGLLGVPQMASSISWYIDAVKQAGVEVVRDGTPSPATIATLEKPLMPPEAYIQMANSRSR
jgi:hypothetical protein